MISAAAAMIITMAWHDDALMTQSESVTSESETQYHRDCLPECHAGPLRVARKPGPVTSSTDIVTGSASAVILVGA